MGGGGGGEWWTGYNNIIGTYQWVIIITDSATCRLISEAINLIFGGIFSCNSYVRLDSGKSREVPIVKFHRAMYVAKSQQIH